MNPRTIGMITTYVGAEIPGLKGRRVMIVAVLRGALGPDVDLNSPDYFVDDEVALARLGGVTARDRIAVAHLRADGTTSFVQCDARAVDLEVFAHLGSDPTTNVRRP